jgi:glycosyltransferase involved in cell wall biosynthesis
MQSAAVIPALNEGATVSAVVAAAAASPLVDEVIVADNRSSDDTREQALAAGARVVPVSSGGKGEAMAVGVAATDAEVIVFLDADLIGLRPYHVDRLVRTVTSGGAVMACGLFDRGPLLNSLFLHVLPILTGERALRRELFTSLDPRELTGFQVEAALNARASELGLPVAAFVCSGMWHRTKEEKFDTPLKGFLAKVRMLFTAVQSYVGYWLRRRVRSWTRRDPTQGRSDGSRVHRGAASAARGDRPAT